MDGRTYAHQLDELIEAMTNRLRHRSGEVEVLDARLKIMELKVTRLISIVERSTGKRMEGR